MLYDIKKVGPPPPGSAPVVRPSSEMPAVTPLSAPAPAPSIRDEGEINRLLANYWEIPASHWLSIPPGAHMRYVTVPGKTAVEKQLFKPGSYVKCHYEAPDGTLGVILETMRGGVRPKGDRRRYIQFSVPFDTVARLWLSEERGA